MFQQKAETHQLHFFEINQSKINSVVGLQSWTTKKRPKTSIYALLGCRNNIWECFSCCLDDGWVYFSLDDVRVCYCTVWMTYGCRVCFSLHDAWVSLSRWVWIMYWYISVWITYGHVSVCLRYCYIWYQWSLYKFCCCAMS